MAISKMTKVIIVSHRCEAENLLEEIQRSSILEVLDAERTTVSKKWPELIVESTKPKDIENLVNRLDKTIKFLEMHSKEKKSILDALAPRTVIEGKQYSHIVSSEQAITVLEQAEKTAANIQQLETEKENCVRLLEMLSPWKSLKTPLEKLTDSARTSCLAGLIPEKNLKNVKEQISQAGAALQKVGQDKFLYACLIVCLKESAAEIQKLLRSADFTAVSFEKMSGTAEQITKQQTEKLHEIKTALSEEPQKAAELANEKFKLGILFDHYQNLVMREQTKAHAPITIHTVLLEGWVKEKDYSILENIVSKFPASAVSKIKPAEDEQIPVDIENKRFVKPFEVITRLYGMPLHLNIDPTLFLAPFFMLFFALCLTDAGYGLILAATSIFLIKKIQVDKKFMWMMLACSIATIFAGALTGGWFGDATQQLFPKLAPIRQKLIWFDPFEKPLTFFALSIALGYIQIITGITIAFVHNLLRKNYLAAVFEQLTWLAMLNFILIFGLSKGGIISPSTGKVFISLTCIPAIAIVLFSERQGSRAARIGMGFYNLFSAIFYLGDILSYVRLMALGMVTAGLAMAINIITKIILDVPYVGFILAVIFFLTGHIFNTAMSGLSAFVHTLRLQYVEFFTKFFIGGGKEFKPLSKKYKYAYIK